MISLSPIKDERFQQGVAFAKKIGCRFDAQRKVWIRGEAALWSFVDDCKRPDQTRESYLRCNGLEIAGEAAASPTDRWMGQASMDHPDSAF